MLLLRLFLQHDHNVTPNQTNPVKPEYQQVIVL
jgi:hypothetical protein